MPPTLPPMQVEAKTASKASIEQEQQQLQSSNFLNNGDVEMFDQLLYGDLDLEVKLSDAISGFKENSKVSGPQAVKTEQAEAPSMLPMQNIVPGVT